jgi:hypothetical protein
MSTITVLDPTAEPRPVPVPLAPRPTTLTGKKIGFLNNSKPNVEALFDTIEERLRERFEVGAVVRRIKKAAGIPAERDLLEEFARECDVAVVAIAD